MKEKCLFCSVYAHVGDRMGILSLSITILGLSFDLTNLEAVYAHVEDRMGILSLSTTILGLSFDLTNLEAA